MISRSSIVVLIACSSSFACDTLPDPATRARPTLTAASSSEAQRPAMVEAALTGGCDPNAFTCLDVQTLEYCGRTGLTEVSCDAVCRSAGLAVSNGCGFEPSLGGDACFCDDVIASSAPGCAQGWSCSGDDTLSYCEAGVSESWDCDAVCQDAGFSGAIACDWDSDSGDESCFCDDAGSSAGCAPGDQVCGDGTCVASGYICDGYDDCASGADEYGCPECTFEGGLCNGSNQVDTCDESGQIATYDCDLVCQQSGYDFSEGCQYDGASHSDSCFCGDAARCLSDELTCGDGSCLAGEYVCDGYVDCPGGDDEIGCFAECMPGEVHCTGDFTIEACDAGQWVDWDCDTVCQDSGYRYAESCSYDSFAAADACFCSY